MKHIKDEYKYFKSKYLVKLLKFSVKLYLYIQCNINGYLGVKAD